VQSAVTRDPAAGVGIASIVADELVAHAVHEGEQLSIKGPDVGLRPKAAESFSLAVHELATNAVKHGALGTARGKIAVSWKLDRNGDDGVLQFEWIERGANGKIAEPERKGFGIELLTRILPYDLGAKPISSSGRTACASR
jgi:two-component system CheB/CheR fusion protein